MTNYPIVDLTALPYALQARELRLRRYILPIARQMRDLRACTVLISDYSVEYVAVQPFIDFVIDRWDMDGRTLDRTKVTSFDVYDPSDYY